jgi:hypothetical protein
VNLYEVWGVKPARLLREFSAVSDVCAVEIVERLDLPHRFELYRITHHGDEEAPQQQQQTNNKDEE